MRIVTWNVNSLRAREERAAALLDRVAPDVICLQELKCETALCPRELFTSRGYDIAVYGQKTYNGVAIASRLPMTDVAWDLPIPGDPMARGITARVDGVRIVDIYLPNGKAVGTDSYTYKLGWMEALRTWLDANADPHEPLVLCGDFNVAPDDRDVYDPDGWREQCLCSTPERDRFKALLDWGLVDAFRMFDDRPGQYTWWDYRGFGFQKKQGLRIDHFLITAPVVARATSVTVDLQERRGDKPSDHAPVILELG